MRLALIAAALAVFGAGGSAAAQLPLPIVETPPVRATEVTGAQAAGGPLVGTFRLTGGSCSGTVSGSHFRMIQPNGGPDAGPFVQNSDSPCADKTYTPLAPGTDGGLVTGEFQRQPDPAFGETGGGRAARITRPQRFYGVNFATATNPTDPQTDTKVAAPRITSDGSGRLSGDLRAFAASWNRQHFNQGSPKPDGRRPGTTAGPSGTYNASSGAFVLEWTSQIAGGPFNNFTGQWHLEGRFVPSSASAPSSEASAPAPSAPAAPAEPAAEPAAAVSQPSAPTAGTTGRSLASTGPSFAASIGVGLLLLALAGLLIGRSARA